MNILVLYDLDNNGKTGKSYNNVNCILRPTARICLFNIIILDNNIVYKNRILNINLFNIVIFNYNEDKLIIKNTRDTAEEYTNLFRKKFKNWDNFLEFMIKIKNIISAKNIKIYNNPENHTTIVNSYNTYEFIKNKNIPINIPKSRIINSQDLDNINNYPIILSLCEQSGGKFKFLCKNREELFKNYEILQKYNEQDYFNLNKDIMISEFLDAKIKELDLILSIRIFCINDILVDYFSRPSQDWNCRATNQILDKSKLLDADLFFKKWLEKNSIPFQKILTALYKNLGYGLYCHDLLIQNDNIYLTELGYKSYDPKYHKLLDKNNIKLNKRHENINLYIKYYNQIIRDYL